MIGDRRRVYEGLTQLVRSSLMSNTVSLQLDIVEVWLYKVFTYFNRQSRSFKS